MDKQNWTACRELKTGIVTFYVFADSIDIEEEVSKPGQSYKSVFDSAVSNFSCKAVDLIHVLHEIKIHETPFIGFRTLNERRVSLGKHKCI